MSWNASIQYAKLYKAFLSLSTTALTNPMIANLNMATFNINNVNTINAVSGTTLTLNADSAHGITVSTKLLIPNHPLIMTNNTADDSLQVGDNISDTSVFRIDHNGNVGIKSNPANTLGHALVVNGSANVTGHINVPTLPSGTNDTQVATTAFVQSAIGGSTISAVNGGTGISATTSSGVVTVANSGVTSLLAGSNISLSGSTGAVTINSIENGVSSVAVGTGLSTTGSTGAITLTNSGVTSIVAGTAVSVSAGTGAVTITNTGIRTLTAGTAITLGGTTNDPTVINNGVTSIIAGTAMTISGSSGAVTINNNGVTSISAGTDITIGGTANIPVINAPRNISLQSSVIDIPASASARSQSLTTATIANAFIFSSTSANAYVNLVVPTASQLASAFGSSAIIEFYIGNLGVTIGDPSNVNVILNVNTVSADNNSLWATNFTDYVAGVSLMTSNYVSMKDSSPNTARLHNAQYKVLIMLQGSKAYYFFDYRGIP